MHFISRQNISSMLSDLVWMFFLPLVVSYDSAGLNKVISRNGAVENARIFQDLEVFHAFNRTSFVSETARSKREKRTLHRRGCPPHFWEISHNRFRRKCCLITKEKVSGFHHRDSCLSSWKASDARIDDIDERDKLITLMKWAGAKTAWVSRHGRHRAVMKDTTRDSMGDYAFSWFCFFEGCACKSLEISGGWNSKDCVSYYHRALCCQTDTFVWG